VSRLVFSAVNHSTGQSVVVFPRRLLDYVRSLYKLLQPVKSLDSEGIE